MNQPKVSSISVSVYVGAVGVGAGDGDDLALDLAPDAEPAGLALGLEAHGGAFGAEELADQIPNPEKL